MHNFIDVVTLSFKAKRKSLVHSPWLSENLQVHRVLMCNFFGVYGTHTGVDLEKIATLIDCFCNLLG